MSNTQIRALYTEQIRSGTRPKDAKIALSAKFNLSVRQIERYCVGITLASIQQPTPLTAPVIKLTPKPAFEWDADVLAGLPDVSADFEIRQPKILLWDLESAPNLGYIWGKYEQNVIEYVSEWHLLSWAAKWLDSDEIICKSLPEYPGYVPNTEDDKELLKDLWKLLDEADICIAHNGRKFDHKRANTRFLEHGLPPPSPYKLIDTLTLSRRYFAFNSNKLDDLGRRLGVGRKSEHSGFKLWRGCMSGDPESWEMMREYNKQDVLLLERVYLKLRSWQDGHPNLNAIAGREQGCSKCGSSKIVRNGSYLTATGSSVAYLCEDCHGYSKGRHTKVTSVK